MIPEICRFPWKFSVTPFHIAGNLYYVGNSYVSSHLIDTEEGLILIDTTFPQTVYLLLESIWELGFDPRNIKYILHSHAHYDHCGGTKAIATLSGAKTFLGREDIPFLTERPELTWLPEYGLEYGFIEPFHVDVPLSNGDTIQLGNTRIECIATPGHTPGAMSYFFEISEGNKKYTVGMHGGPGLNTLTDAYLGKYNLSYKNRTMFVQALKILKTKHVDIFIGIHPEQNDVIKKQKKITKETNPLIDPTAWPTFLNELEDRVQKAWGSHLL